MTMTGDETDLKRGTKPGNRSRIMTVCDAAVKRDPRDRGQKQDGSGGVRDMTIPTLRGGRVAKGKWVWGLPPLDRGSARALGTSDTDTLVGIFFTSTALRAGAILVCLTIYPSEMILFQFPPCTGSGHD